MKPALLFLHGWGFDSSIWQNLAGRLGAFDHVYGERGYFGAAPGAFPDGPFLAVAHSFGAMRLLEAVPGSCRGLVAVNGFDRFAASDDFAGVPGRVVDRMRKRFAARPAATLADFRRRCGAEAAAPAIDGAAMGEDLDALAGDDRRREAAAFDGPVLSLQGALDPIMGPAMRDAAFAGVARLERRTVADGGHLLPVTHPDACAAAIRAMAGAGR